MRWLLIAALLLLAPAVHAQSREVSSDEDIGREARYIMLDGPEPGEQRGVSVWRPRNAPQRPLRVLYMADGVVGLNIIVPRLRPVVMSSQIEPIMVVAFASGREHRRAEYYPSTSSKSSRLYDQHQAWFFNTVIPWAERVAGASSDPRERAIGGFSAGAVFALTTAARRPEMFSAVLAHSPVWSTDVGVDARAANIRWVVTAGRDEAQGRILDMVHNINAELRRNGGLVRRCDGPWGHSQDAVRKLSPGSVAWLFNLPQAETIGSPTEQSYCRTLDAR